MTNKTHTRNLDGMRMQLELLKKRLDNMDSVLNIQEKMIDILSESTKEFPSTFKKDDNSTEQMQIMRNAFSNKKLPKILFK